MVVGKKLEETFIQIQLGSICEGFSVHISNYTPWDFISSVRNFDECLCSS